MMQTKIKSLLALLIATLLLLSLSACGNEKKTDEAKENEEKGEKTEEKKEEGGEKSEKENKAEDKAEDKNEDKAKAEDESKKDEKAKVEKEAKTEEEKTKEETTKEEQKDAFVPSTKELNAILIDTEEHFLKLNKVEERAKNDFIFYFSAENRSSGTPYHYESNCNYVNDTCSDSLTSCRLKPGEKGDFQLNINNHDKTITNFLAFLGIDNYSKIEIRYHTRSKNIIQDDVFSNSGTYVYYPKGEENFKPYVRDNAEDVVLLDNDIVKVKAIKYERSEKDTLYLFIENKLDIPIEMHHIILNLNDSAEDTEGGILFFINIPYVPGKHSTIFPVEISKYEKEDRNIPPDGIKSFDFLLEVREWSEEMPPWTEALLSERIHYVTPAK